MAWAVVSERPRRAFVPDLVDLRPSPRPALKYRRVDHAVQLLSLHAVIAVTVPPNLSSAR